MLQLYLKTKVRTANPVNERLERRLYWSCLKSEWYVLLNPQSYLLFEKEASYKTISEIRMEICLPTSGLGKIAYPDVLPTPPIGSPAPTEDSTGMIMAQERGGTLSMASAELETSWRYYLSDIAVRHIANRLVNTFYQDDASSWLSMPIERMSRLAEELDLQLTQWYTLPLILA